MAALRGGWKGVPPVDAGILTQVVGGLGKKEDRFQVEGGGR